jgi:alkanesulfonate monooxygenase SsuD/methylene tetrahydromethanopterin reductase-like flavin-dependent oxidoreductase (luciferase family)
VTDYGHPLEFGTFITPSNADPAATVGLARLSEELGFDLLTFQDHPYQPRFLDTWTLMSWVLASTSRIRVAPNVLNVPLRPPAVVARAAVSLDLLSGGRFELALGAGGFWDAIEAMGGRRLSPGQAVQALEEAIDVIHGIWDVSTRDALIVPGEFHHLRGAKRGPEAAHDIPIWVGARGPRMMGLIGRKADGWLPSLGGFEPAELTERNAIIDEAAIAAGRSPADVRRLVNVPVDLPVESLVRLAIDDGFSVFVAAADDPDALRRFAVETVPAVRDAVVRERS